MQKGHILQFDCQECQQPVRFSLFQLEERSEPTLCGQCGKKYGFHDEQLKRQLKKFALLCQQLVDSEEILANTAVGIDVGNHSVKIPYKLLLTRLNSLLELNIDGKPLSIEFRLEPLQDFPRSLVEPVAKK